MAQAEEIAKLQPVVDRLLAGVSQPRVLEAGCGSLSNVRMPSDAYVVGIDISRRQLERNADVVDKITGDIQTYPLPHDSFDAIVSWEVLEHVEFPERALLNFVDALKAGGIIVLALPNVLSIKGMLTKVTPLSFHVWAWKHLFGIDHAGKDELGPFPTYIKLSISAPGIHRFARQHGLTVEHFSIYEAGKQERARRKLGITAWRWTLIKRLVKKLSLGRIDADLSDFMIILRKPVAIVSTQPVRPLVASGV